MATKKNTKKAEDKKAPAVNLWKREQGWDKLDEKELKQLETYCDEYIQFLSKA
jgi:hypothetical protein